MDQKLNHLIEEYGSDLVQTYTSFVNKNASEMVKSILPSVKPGSYLYKMDNDIDGNKRQIAVSVELQNKPLRVTIDFSGTTLQTKTNFNEKLENINWEIYYKDLPFNPSALSLYKWAPIAEELKTLDRKIVLNSMILKWDIIKKEFNDLIQF